MFGESGTAKNSTEISLYIFYIMAKIQSHTLK
jgi:hypothetical protein